MPVPYDLLRQRCNLSQQDAADYHRSRLDTVVSWCNGRRQVPLSALNELRELYSRIQEAGDELAAIISSLPPAKDDRGNDTYFVGLPLDDRDSRACGFPTPGSHDAALAIAIAKLPVTAGVKLVPRERGAIPTAVVSDSSFLSDRSERDAPMPEPLTADNNAKFNAIIQATPEGPQATFAVKRETKDGAQTQSDIRLFKGKSIEEARDWVDQEAKARGFMKYALRYIDQNGQPLK